MEKPVSIPAANGRSKPTTTGSKLASGSSVTAMERSKKRTPRPKPTQRPVTEPEKAASTMPTDNPQLFRASLTDPSASFRHLVETQRNAAISHESFLLMQLQTLQEDLASVRSVIVGCDSALASTNPPVEEVFAPPQMPSVDPNSPPPPTPPEPVLPPPASPALRAVQDALDRNNPPATIPSFLTVPKVASAS